MSLRFRYRHVHATLFDYVRSSLIDLGWGNAALPADDPANLAVNFGTPAATYIDNQPDEAGVAVAPNTIAVTLGDEPAAEDLELGGGLLEVAFPVYVDIYGQNQSIAVSIASDVKAMLEDHFLTVCDYTARPPAPTDEVIEIDKEDVDVSRPQAAIGSQDFKRYWRVVRARARVHYID